MRRRRRELARARIEAREEIEMLGDAERFVFHRAAEMNLAETAFLEPRRKEIEARLKPI